MKITATVSQIPDWFATKEQLAGMTDAEIMELINEDIGSFLEEAQWSIER